MALCRVALAGGRCRSVSRSAALSKTCHRPTGRATPGPWCQMWWPSPSQPSTRGPRDQRGKACRLGPSDPSAATSCSALSTGSSTAAGKCFRTLASQPLEHIRFAGSPCAPRRLGWGWHAPTFFRPSNRPQSVRHRWLAETSRLSPFRRPQPQRISRFPSRRSCGQSLPW